MSFPRIKFDPLSIALCYYLLQVFLKPTVDTRNIWCFSSITKPAVDNEWFTTETLD